MTVALVQPAHIRTIRPAEIRTIRREAEQFTINRSNHRRSLRQRTSPPNLSPVRTPRHTIRRVTHQRTRLIKHTVSRTRRRIITITRRQHVIHTMRSPDIQHHKPLPVLGIRSQHAAPHTYTQTYRPQHASDAW